MTSILLYAGYLKASNTPDANAYLENTVPVLGFTIQGDSEKRLATQSITRYNVI